MGGVRNAREAEEEKGKGTRGGVEVARERERERERERDPRVAGLRHTVRGRRPSD